MDGHAALTTIYGAIVGGPDQSDYYGDIRTDYQHSEIGMDYQGGFTGTAAALSYYQSNGVLAPCGAGGCYEGGVSHCPDS